MCFTLSVACVDVYTTVQFKTHPREIFGDISVSFRNVNNYYFHILLKQLFFQA